MSYYLHIFVGFGIASCSIEFARHLVCEKDNASCFACNQYNDPSVSFSGILLATFKDPSVCA